MTAFYAAAVIVCVFITEIHAYADKNYTNDAFMDAFLESSDRLQWDWSKWFIKNHDMHDDGWIAKLSLAVKFAGDYTWCKKESAAKYWTCGERKSLKPRTISHKFNCPSKLCECAWIGHESVRNQSIRFIRTTVIAVHAPLVHNEDDDPSPVQAVLDKQMEAFVEYLQGGVIHGFVAIITIVCCCCVFYNFMF
eukprot:359458_1